jgi:hypothetical protein
MIALLECQSDKVYSELKTSARVVILLREEFPFDVRQEEIKLIPQNLIYMPTSTNDPSSPLEQ